jgi:hypothetical protein
MNIGVYSFEKQGFSHLRNQTIMTTYWAGRTFVNQAQNLPMRTFIALILWAILLVLCWPIALILLFLFPLIWLILLPFKIIGLSINLVFQLVGAILMFPFRVLKSA